MFHKLLVISLVCFSFVAQAAQPAQFQGTPPRNNQGNGAAQAARRAAQVERRADRAANYAVVQDERLQVPGVHLFPIFDQEVVNNQNGLHDAFAGLNLGGNNNQGNRPQQ